MRKILLLLVLVCGVSHAFGRPDYRCFITTTCNPPTTGNNYAYVEQSTWTDRFSYHYYGIDYDGLTQYYSLCCSDPGGTSCTFTISAGDFTDATVQAAVQAQVASGIYTGQIYSNGASGTSSYDDEYISADLPCYLWKTTDGITVYIKYIDVAAGN